MVERAHEVRSASLRQTTKASIVRPAGLYLPGLTARGGAERLTLVMALELARAGVDTTIFTTDPASIDEIENDLGEAIGSLKIETLPAPRHASRLRAVQQARIDQVESVAIRARKLDLFINCDSRSSLPGCGRMNIFYCHFPHDLRPGGGSLVNRAYLRVLDLGKRVLIDRNVRGFLATYQQIWANSRFTGGHVEGIWGRTAEVVYPPCDMLHPLEKERLIVAVGRFQAGKGPEVPHKSQEYLIDAFSRLGDLHSEGWRFLLLGGASASDELFLASLREQSAGLPVEISANPSRAEIADAFGVASIFWHAQGVDGDAAKHPRSQEHFGISTVEAMSAAALPLVYGVAGPAEIVGHGSALRPWQDSQQLLDATRRLAALSAEERDPMSRMCIARAHDFDREHFARRLRSLLRIQPDPAGAKGQYS